MLFYYVKIELTPCGRERHDAHFARFTMKLPGFVSAFLRLFTGTNNGMPSVSPDKLVTPVAEPKVEPPPNLDWMLPDSEPKKLELAGKQVGEVVNDYLWYDLGDVRSLERDEVDAIKTKFFVGGQAGFGDIELHRSSVLPGNRTVLRLRGRLYFHLSLELRGHYCALYQVGHSGGFLPMPTEGSVNFHKYWNEGVLMTNTPVSAPS